MNAKEFEQIKVGDVVVRVGDESVSGWYVESVSKDKIVVKQSFPIMHPYEYENLANMINLYVVPNPADWKKRTTEFPKDGKPYSFSGRLSGDKKEKMSNGTS